VVAAVVVGIPLGVAVAARATPGGTRQSTSP
jgi:hypothetical protein